MIGEKLFHLREILLDTRKDLIQRVTDLESRWQEMGERAIEIEEEAQKESMALPYDRLDESGKQTIRQIDLALSKIISGEYGICEHCEDDIPPGRLEAVPWTRLCIDCARELEHKHIMLPLPEEAAEPAEIPDEYQGLSNSQILRIIHDEIERDGKIDTEELDISIRGGVVHLNGNVPGEPERQILLQLLTDVLGFSEVIDRLTVAEVEFKTEGNSPEERSSTAGSTFEDRMFYDAEEFSEDLSEEAEDLPYSPPEEPPAQPLPPTV